MTQSRRKDGKSGAGSANERGRDGAGLSPRPRPPSARTQRDGETIPFWRKPLDKLNKREWEALCDGCGRCCLVKLEDEDTGKIHFTDVACKLFESGTCRCADYAHRRRKVGDCVKLTPENVGSITWLPPTCAYRLRREGRDLPDWHPLLTGDPNSVHTAGISARERVSAFEDDVEIEDLPDFIVSWPGKWPKGAKRPKRSAR